MRHTAVCLILLLLMQIVSAAPPPGDSEVSNQICSTWESTEGICDDYDSTLDATITDEWIEGQVIMLMDSASTIEMSLDLAIFELPRDELDLIDIDLEGDSISSDGIPADYIRNYRNLVQGGSSVEDRMVEYVDDIIQQIVDENFPGAIISPIQPTSEILFFSRSEVSCTYNSDIDSIDEVTGRENNPFYPPICLRSVLTLNIDPTNIGMNPDTGDVDRMMEGLMSMGGEVTSNFTTVAAAGHYLEYLMIPPIYSSIHEVNPPGEKFELDQNKKGARVVLDNLAGSPLLLPTTIDLVATLGSGMEAPNWQNNAGPSFSLELFIDVSDRMNSRIDMEISIHHIDTNMLTEWGLNLETSTINLDTITSDGIRMFDSEMNIDTEDMLTSIPIDSLSSTFSEALGVDVMFQTPTFSPSHDTGGLMFQHIPGQTCEENLAYRYCLGTSNSMASTYPILIQTSSMPSEMQVSNIVNQLIQHAEGDISTMDLSIMNDEDLASLMSVLGIELEVDLGYLQDLMPENFAGTDVKMTVYLPEWLESSENDQDSIVFISSFGESSKQEIALQGARPYDWRHAICIDSGRSGAGDPTECTDESEDLICGSNQQTCISSFNQIDIEKVSLKETRSAIEIDFSLSSTIELYRLGVVEDEPNIEITPIPSDIIHRIISIGDRREGGLLEGSEQKAIIPFSTGDYEMEISNNGLSDLSSVLVEEIELSLEQLEEMGAQEIVLGGKTYQSEFDIKSIPFSIGIPDFVMPPDRETSDLDPVEVTVKVNKASLTITLRGDEISGSIGPASYRMGVTNQLVESIESLLGLEFTNTGVSVTDLSFISFVPPLMEHTTWGTIKSSARMEISLPSEIKIISFDSELNLGTLVEGDGKQVIQYRTPVCPNADTWSECYAEKDKIEWKAEVSWMMVLGELAPYLLIVSLIIGQLTFKIIRKRIEVKKSKKDTQTVFEEQLIELELAAQMGELDEKIITENGVFEEEWFEDLK